MNVVQKQTATLVAQSRTVTLGSAPAAGNLLVMVAASNGGTDNALTTPTGWTATSHTVAAGVDLYMFYRVAGGSESATTTAIGYTTGSQSYYSSPIVVYEIAGLTATPYNVSASAASAGGVTSLPSGTTGTTAQADELCTVAYGIGQTPNPITSYTAGYVQQDVVTESVNATICVVAFRETSATGAQSCTATSGAVTYPSGAAIAAFKVAGSGLVAPINLHTTSVGSTSIDIAWNAVTGAAGYEVTITATSLLTATASRTSTGSVTATGTVVAGGSSGIYPHYRGFLANRTGDLEAQGGKVTQYDVVVCNAGYYSQLTSLKSTNPSTLFYKYMNSIACITGSNDHVGQNNVLWSVADANETWFLHTTSAVRMILADYTTNSYMDPAIAGYQSGWAAEAAYVKNTLGWHGVFIDDVDTYYGGHLGGQTPAKYSYAGGVTNPGYTTAEQSWCVAVGPSLRSNGVKHIGNAAIYYEGQTPYRANMDKVCADLDASTFEFWVTQGNTDPLVPYTTTDHAALLDRGLYTQATLHRGFVPLVYFNPAASNYSQMYRYTYYSFLLTVDPTLPSAFMVTGYSGSQSPDVPTYYGNPTATYQSRGTYCYSRTFSNAGTNYTIYVNADTASHSLDGHTIPALDGLVV